MSDRPTTTTTASEIERFRRAERHLRNELTDPECTGWTCPTCGWGEYKVHGLECDRCGFNAEPYLCLEPAK